MTTTTNSNKIKIAKDTPIAVATATCPMDEPSMMVVGFDSVYVVVAVVSKTRKNI